MRVNDNVLHASAARRGWQAIPPIHRATVCSSLVRRSTHTHTVSCRRISSKNPYPSGGNTHTTPFFSSNAMNHHHRHPLLRWGFRFFLRSPVSVSCPIRTWWHQSRLCLGRRILSLKRPSATVCSVWCLIHRINPMMDYKLTSSLHRFLTHRMGNSISQWHGNYWNQHTARGGEKNKLNDDIRRSPLHFLGNLYHIYFIFSVSIS